MAAHELEQPIALDRRNSLKAMRRGPVGLAWTRREAQRPRRGLRL